MSKTTEEWTEGLSEKGIEFYHKIESIGSGELKGYGELSASSWAASRQRDVLYKKDGLEFELPLHRVMSNDDKYACVDNEFGLGLIEHALNDESRRVYKCALREIEGAYAKGDEPSKKGLPPRQRPSKRRKAGDGDEPPGVMMKMKIGPGVGLDELVDEVANAMGIDKESLAFGDVEEVEDGTKVQLYVADQPIPADIIRVVVERMRKFMSDRDLTPADLYHSGRSLLKVLFVDPYASK